MFIWEGVAAPSLGNGDVEDDYKYCFSYKIKSSFICMQLSVF